MADDFANVYEDSPRAEAYAGLECPGTCSLAFRDLPTIVQDHVGGQQAPDMMQTWVDGHRMQLLVAGHGTPTHVLEADGGSTSRTGRTLQPLLAAMARVVSHDRACVRSHT
jgi:hypothetical protein